MNQNVLGLNSPNADLEERIRKLEAQGAGQRTEETVGNVYGGFLRTEIAPGLVKIGPFYADVDSTYGLERVEWIPTEVLRIRRMTLRLTPRPSRLAVGLVETIDAQTAEATGDIVNVADSGHVHIWLSRSSTTAMHSGVSVLGGTVTNTPSATTQVAVSPHNHTFVGSPTNNDTAPISVGSSTHVHGPGGIVQTVPTTADFDKWGTYNSAGSADATRAFDIIPIAGSPADMYTAVTSASPVSVATADHTHEVAGHNHDVTLAISEQGMATGMAILIDGVDRTALLGGPWNAAASIDLDTNKLIAVGLIDIRGTVSTGPHTFKVTSTAEGAIELTGDYYCIIKAVQ